MTKIYLPALWLLTLPVLMPVVAAAQKVEAGDVSMAQTLRTKIADSRYAALSSTEEYNFDRGKNELGQPVVTATGHEQIQFIALNDIPTTFRYAETYNQFVELKKFRLSMKSGEHYSTAKDKPSDQALTDDNIFLDDNRIQYYDITLNKTGQMAQVESEMQFNDCKYLTRIFFHTYFPVKERSIRFVAPQWLQLEFKEMNFEGYTIKKTQEPDGKNTVYTFTMKDLDGVKSENDNIGMAFTHPHIIVMVKAFEYDKAPQKGFQETADLYRWYNFLYTKCKNDPATLKPLAESLVKGKTSNIDKVKALYYWVQDNIRYIAFENGYAGFIPDPAQHVLKDKYGDCKGMANLLTEMLKLTGFDAHFTWIGTRDIPYDHATTPAMCVDNHAICTLYLDGKTYFLDATESYVPFGENAYRIQGKSALIQNGDHYDLKYVPVSDKNANKLITHASFTLNGSLLKGHVKVTLTGNERTSFHQVYQDMPVDKQQNYLKSLLEFGNDNLTASGITTSDLKNRELPVTIEGDIELNNNVTTAGNDVYASVDFFPKSLNRFMPDNKRQRGYDFESLFTYEDDIQLTIPADKKFIDVPAETKLEYPSYSFHGSYVVNGNTIALKKSLAIQSGQIARKDFPNWTVFLKNMKDFNSNQISITKK